MFKMRIITDDQFKINRQSQSLKSQFTASAFDNDESPIRLTRLHEQCFEIISPMMMKNYSDNFDQLDDIHHFAFMLIFRSTYLGVEGFPWTFLLLLRICRMIE
jgi:hypothetical protein